MKKEEGTFYLLDSICGWVRMTPYLEKVYGFLVNKHLDIEEGRVVYLTGYGAAGIVNDGDKHSANPRIPDEYRNDKGNHCVWLSAALLVRKKSPSLSETMIEGMNRNLNMFEGLTISGHRGQKTLMELLKTFTGVYGSKYKSKQKVVRVLDKGERILPKCLVGSKKDMLIVCSLVSEAGDTGHCVGIDADKRLIWDPSRRYAMDLTLENLDDCCTFGGVESKFVEFGMVGHIRVKVIDKK
jgi:hypothetical protein